TIKETAAFLENYRRIESPLFWNESGRKLRKLEAALRQGRKDPELVKYVKSVEKNCAEIIGDIDTIEHTTRDVYNRLSNAVKDIANEKQTLKYLRGLESKEVVDRLYERAEGIESKAKTLLQDLESFHKEVPEFVGRMRSLRSYADAMK
ncbi:MAG: hypothetical protein KAV87_01765, partial [Desulfobacteraceae bacterium]|nr:hypothetical protein [Desulfobacteraceae bacterium]